jgi:phospholipid/cholesterol/gamma-HCH transport system substrate-binding protein
MIKKKTYFLVGFFVLAGALIAIGTIIWLGASQYLQKGERFVPDIDASVQGLQVDSSVKYRGVEIGMVEKIGVAPDYRLIEVVMKINFSGRRTNATIAKLKAAGITGIVYVDWTTARRETSQNTADHLRARLSRHPFNPSEIQEIVSGVDDVVKKMKEVTSKPSPTNSCRRQKASTPSLRDKDDGIITNLENMTRTLSDSATSWQDGG